MGGKSKADGLTILQLKSQIKAEQQHIAAETVKPPRKIACGAGLQLWVMGEAMYWRLPYRFGGKQKVLALGVCNPAKPELSEAREKALEAKRQLAAGLDPNQARQDDKHAKAYAHANTFEAVALEWHAKELASGTWKPKPALIVMQRLIANLFPMLGKRPIESLTTRDLMGPLRKLESAGTLNVANRVRQYTASIMRHAIQTGRIDKNPALDLQGAISSPKASHHPALPLNQLPELLQRIRGYTGLQVVCCAAEFALLTGARSSEFRFSRWSEFDLVAGIWTIPEKREAVENVKYSERGEKMARVRVIYLSTQAVTLLKFIQSINGKELFVFKGQKRDTPLGEGTINLMLNKLGYSTQLDICLHGFRTMMVSSLNESLQFSADAIELHIGHESKNEVRGIYNRNAQYLAERQRMLQWWADYLHVLETGTYIPPADFKIQALQELPKLRVVA